MRRSAVLALTVAAFAFTGVTAEAAQRRAGSAGRSPQNGAQDSALVDLHELRREGGRVCMAEHSHVGTSGEQPSRKAAEVVAQREWAGFTAWEYGDQWGNPALAASKVMTCSGGGASYSCDFEARPCRR